MTATFSQTAKDYYDQGMAKARAGNLEDAIKLFSQSIELNGDEWIVWYNRGIARTYTNNYDEALTDFNQVIKLVPDNKKAYLNRASARKHLTDYDGAIADYNYALELDPAYTDAFYNLGLVYEMLDKKDSACIYFTKAKDNGIKEAQGKIDKCKDHSKPLNNYFSILRLTKKADNKNYGFTPEDPIKVGFGPNGGPANQRAYLELLRDQKGKPVKFTRLGSCCMYDSPNGLMGKGMLDKYEITYLDENGATAKTILYISFDDYEELKIPYGFKTIGE